MNDINDIIEDLLKIYLTGIDAYNSKIYQTVNDKYTIIDKSMLTVYLFVKIIEERNEKNKEITDCLANYLIKQYIYGETGNLSFEILDKTKAETYNKILDELITEKFKYKNRLMKKLKYEYTGIVLNEYSELLIFLENIADFAIFQKMILRGNSEVQKNINDTKNKIINQLDKLNINELFYNEKKKLIELIKYNQFFDSEYGKLMEVALNLKDVYRYSMITTQIPENVLFHQYTVTDYNSAYHVLESISKYDYPSIGGITGRRKEITKKSKYTKKKQALINFEDLFRQANFNHILVSYSTQGLV